MNKTDDKHGAVKNTDRELWREREGDYYADSIHVNEQGNIGINCGGFVIVKPVREWHRLASAKSAIDAPCQTCDDSPTVCATVPGLRNCEKAQRVEERRSGWIPVSERKPGDGVKVLVSPGYAEETSIDQWCDQYDSFLMRIEDGRQPTHWMPLPAAPGEAAPTSGPSEVPCRHEWYHGTCAHCKLDADEYRASLRLAGKTDGTHGA